MIETNEFVATPTGERIGSLLKELMSIVMQRSSGEMLSIMSEASLSMPQLVALQKLERCGPHSISAIAAWLNLSLAATSHLVERMVQQGFVTRTEDLHDRRHKSVVILPAGKALLDRLVEARVRDINQVLAVLPAELRVDLQHALAHIVETLQDAPMPSRAGERSGGSGRKKQRL